MLLYTYEGDLFSHYSCKMGPKINIPGSVKYEIWSQSYETLTTPLSLSELCSATVMSRAGGKNSGWTSLSPKKQELIYVTMVTKQHLLDMVSFL